MFASGTSHFTYKTYNLLIYGQLFFVSQVVKFKFPSNISDITTAANTSIGLRQEDPALGIFKCLVLAE